MILSFFLQISNKNSGNAKKKHKNHNYRHQKAL